MKIQPRNVRFFQDGGQAPALEDQDQGQEQAPKEAPDQGQEQAPEDQGGQPQGGQDPMAQILQVAAQAVQTKNCEAAMAVCQALLQLAQGGAGQQQAPQEEPTFAKYGAKLIKVRR